MRHLTRLCVGGLVGLASACNAAKPHVEQVRAEQHWNQVRGQVKYQLAEQQYEGGLFDEAVRAVSESLALDPTQADAYVLLARSYLELGKPASAQQALDAARRAGLASADLLYTEGVVAEQRGQFDTALKHYEHAQSLDPTNVDYLVAQAECLVAMDRPSEALALLDKHAGRVNEDATVTALVAHISQLLGRPEDAANHYRQAIAPDTRDTLITEELGLLLSRSGRHYDALRVLEPLLEDPAGVPVTGGVRRALANCYLATGQADSAVEVLGEYTRANPQDTLAQLLLAKAAITVGDLWTALRAINAAEKREPNHPEVKLVRAVVQWQRGQLTAAAVSLREVLVLAPNDADAHRLMANLLLAQDKSELARTHFQRARQIDIEGS